MPLTNIPLRINFGTLWADELVCDEDNAVRLQVVCDDCRNIALELRFPILSDTESENPSLLRNRRRHIQAKAPF